VKGLVHVVEDDPSVRSALVRVLVCAGFEARACSSASEFLAGDRDERPSCIVLDIGLPGMSGIELQAALEQSNDRSRQIVFVTGRGDIAMCVGAMKRGAVDFLTKPVRTEALLQAVRTALARDARMRGEDDEIRALRANYQRLTPREREVYAGVIRGLLNKQIAEEIGTSMRTVKAHRARVMAKMEARSIVELVSAAARLEREHA
jgi:FixJ family two-component response regulator